MNLLKDVLNPNSDYNKKFRADGIALITESYEKVIDLLDNLKGMIEDSQGNDYDYAFRTAIEALEKQIPKEPAYDGDGYAPDGSFVWDEWLCPKCNSRYEVDYDEYDYCPNCGQAIKWE